MTEEELLDKCDYIISIKIENDKILISLPATKLVVDTPKQTIVITNVSTGFMFGQALIKCPKYAKSAVIFFIVYLICLKFNYHAKYLRFAYNGEQIENLYEKIDELFFVKESNKTLAIKQLIFSFIQNGMLVDLTPQAKQLGVESGFKVVMSIINGSIV